MEKNVVKKSALKESIYVALVAVGYTAIAGAAAILETEKILPWKFLVLIFLIASVAAYAGVILILRQSMHEPIVDRGK